MPIFQSISSDELSILTASLASGFSKALNLSDLNIFGNFLAAVGSTILTLAALEEAQKKQEEELDKEKAHKQEEADKKTETDISSQIEELKKQIQKLQKEIKQMQEKQN